jgi:uncharacterized protein
MVFYLRDLEKKLQQYIKFPIIALLGPRQAGKTTLARHTFANYAFVSLDDPEFNTLARTDPKGFLRKFDNEDGIIIDEFQNAPELLPYLKVIVDEKDRPGYFVLTGSQNFLMSAAITQSLAGRVGILTLLPLSIDELKKNNLIEKEGPELTIFRGGYPRLYTHDFHPQELYASYLRTYVERDVRQLTNVTNLSTFGKFLKLCAARIGQLLNFSDLAMQCGISVPTVHQWLSILEASYIIFLLRPHWVTFTKRVIKTPKLYFYDTGLACLLLEIESERTLAINPLYGSLFECLIIADFYKQYYNQGLTPPLYFWRDKNGDIEVDCLIQKDATLLPVEIKSGETYTPRFFSSLHKWHALDGNSRRNSIVVYAGTLSFSGSEGTLIPWVQAGTLIEQLSTEIG